VVSNPLLLLRRVGIERATRNFKEESMSTIDTTIAAPVSRASTIAGWVLSGVAIAFLVMDGTMKLVPFDVVITTMTELGYDPGLSRGLGVLILACTILYAIPRTSVLVAVLLTGLLGGAVATHLRIASPVFSHLLFGVYLGLFVWGGVWLRDAQLRAIFPFRR
jgi:hypothetical protein